MSSERNALTGEEINEIASLTDGYSGADMKNLCQEASLGPIRSISFSAMHQITADQVFFRSKAVAEPKYYTLN